MNADKKRPQISQMTQIRIGSSLICVICEICGLFSLQSVFIRVHLWLNVFMLDWLKSLFAAEEPKHALADRGENVAAKHLRNNGYRILARNYRCEGGEIDIIARKDKELVFVEVKSRAYDDPTPEEQVNSEKQRRVVRAGKIYLTRYGQPQPPARFDVIAVVWPTGQPPILRHTEGAFGDV